MKTLYMCEICNKQFDTPAKAQQCENIGLEQVPFEAGDYVTTHGEDYGRFGWYDGDPDWVLKKPHGLHSQKPYDGTYLSFIYIVTAVTNRGHRAIIHLRTKAMKDQYVSGWTSMTGHHTPHLFKTATEGAPTLGGTEFVGEVCGRHDLI